MPPLDKLDTSTRMELQKQGMRTITLVLVCIPPTATATVTSTPVPTNTPTVTATPTDTQQLHQPPQQQKLVLRHSTPTATVVVTDEPTATPTLLVGLGVPEGNSEVLIPVTGADLSGGSVAGKVLLSLGFGFLGLGIVSYGLKKKQ